MLTELVEVSGARHLGRLGVQSPTFLPPRFDRLSDRSMPFREVTEPVEVTVYQCLFFGVTPSLNLLFSAKGFLYGWKFLMINQHYRSVFTCVVCAFTLLMLT